MAVCSLSSPLSNIFVDYQQLSIRYDPEEAAIWFYMNPHPRPCFTPTLLSEIRLFQTSLIDNYDALKRENAYPIQYLVLASQNPGVFNLGGDLNLFAQHIMDRNREHLLQYATACIDVLYQNTVHLQLPVTTISLVEGSALGGGFEAALSSNVLIAEEGADLGLPEILFNLFPGMGAYSLLARRIGMVEAEKMLTSGKTYSAAELYEMGVVDVLAETGTGKEAVRNYIKRHMRSNNGLRAIRAARQRYNPITYEELLDITKIWVDAALNLTRKDLRMMQRLVKAQDKNRCKTLAPNGQVRVLRTRQNRRVQASSVFPCLDHRGNVIEHNRRCLTDRRLATMTSA